MSDRELLEWAAKAAEIPYNALPHSDSDWLKWNPLTDDGDALRLAVKLGMRVCIDIRAGFSWVKGHEGSEPHNGDPYAATRRAIVRAAATVGRNK